MRFHVSAACVCMCFAAVQSVKIAPFKIEIIMIFNKKLQCFMHGLIIV